MTAIWTIIGFIIFWCLATDYILAKTGQEHVLLFVGRNETVMSPRWRLLKPG